MRFGCRFNALDVTASIAEAFKAVNAVRGTTFDKSQQPLPAVVAASGQGKTEVLRWIREDDGESLHQSLIDALNSGPSLPKIKHIAPLMASFNQGTYFHADRDIRADAALISRLIPDYYGRKFINTLKISNDLTLQTLTAFIRNEVATAKRILPKEVAVVLLVDEIGKITGDMYRDVLISICNVMHSDCSDGFATIPVVTSLEMTSIFDYVTTKSRRPLIPIRLSPVSVDESMRVIGMVEMSLIQGFPSESMRNQARARCMFLALSYLNRLRSLEVF